MSIAVVDRVSFWPGDSPAPALDGLSLQIGEGEVLLVDGPSGSGKSTLLRALAGLIPHFHGGRFAGRVTVMGHDTRSAGPAQMAAVVGSVFQEPETQAVRSTVSRDVAFGLENLGTPAADIPSQVAAALDRVGAAHLGDRSIASLSAGERQRVAIAGAIAPGPGLVLMDEPTSQLDDRSVDRLVETVAGLAAAGTAVVIAEHHVERFAGLAARRMTLVDGQVATQSPEVERPDRRVTTGRPVLELDGIAAGYGDLTVLVDADLVVPSGSITAVHGANGSGKSTLARVIAGLHDPERGRVRLDGRNITALPAELRHPQIGFLRQDAGRWLLTEHVTDEVGSACRHLDAPARESARRLVLEELDLTEFGSRHPLDLSVGERERVALACVLAAGPRVVVLDEPSRGMDPARRERLARALVRRADGGAAIVLVTHDDDLARIADRHVAIVEGRVVTHRERIRR